MNQEAFIRLIQEKISFYQQQVEDTINHSYSILDKYKQLLSALHDDYTYFTGVSIGEIRDILEEVSLPLQDKERELKHLKSIFDLLELNETKGTTFQLSASQKECLDLFKHQVEQLVSSSQNTMSEQLEEVSGVTNKVKRLKVLLGKVEDEKNMEYILKEDLLDDLFSSLDEKEQEELLYYVLDYNHGLYVDKMNQKEMDERPRLNMEEVKEIFDNFGYDFTKLSHANQDLLLTYGQIQKIPEIFECLERNLFPRFDLKRSGKKLVSILINSDAPTIDEIASYCLEKDIPLSVLLYMIPVIIKQDKFSRMGERVGKGFIVGRSDDFKKNIKFFEEIGLSLSSVLRNFRELLMMSNSKLLSNYQKLIQYGFVISEEDEKRLCDSLCNILLSKNFDEIVDQFIEVHREGPSYIKNHMSRVSTITSSDDLLFYRLYEANKNQDEIDTVIDNIEYQDITPNNKLEKTDTVLIECDAKEEFDQAVLKHRGKDEELYNLIFNDSCILSLEEYVDPDNPIRYNFDGVLISKPKVIKIYNILKNEHLDSLEDSLFYAITYHSILSEDSIRLIQRIVKDRGE